MTVTAARCAGVENAESLLFAEPIQFNPFAADNDCELMGWGSKHTVWNDGDYRDHPGNPDRWQDEDDDDDYDHDE